MHLANYRQRHCFNLLGLCSAVGDRQEAKGFKGKDFVIFNKMDFLKSQKSGSSNASSRVFYKPPSSGIFTLA